MHCVFFSSNLGNIIRGKHSHAYWCGSCPIRRRTRRIHLFVAESRQAPFSWRDKTVRTEQGECKQLSLGNTMYLTGFKGRGAQWGQETLPYSPQKDLRSHAFIVKRCNAESCPIQGSIFCLTHRELTEDHVLTSAYVQIFRTVTRNAVYKSVWRKMIVLDFH